MVNEFRMKHGPRREFLHNIQNRINQERLDFTRSNKRKKFTTQTLSIFNTLIRSGVSITLSLVSGTSVHWTLIVDIDNVYRRKDKTIEIQNTLVPIRCVI